MGSTYLEEACTALYDENLTPGAKNAAMDYLDTSRIKKWKPLDRSTEQADPKYAFCYLDNDVENSNTDPVLATSGCNKAANSVFNKDYIEDMFANTDYESTRKYPYKKCVVKINKDKLNLEEKNKFWNGVQAYQCDLAVDEVSMHIKETQARLATCQENVRALVKEYNTLLEVKGRLEGLIANVDENLRECLTNKAYQQRDFDSTNKDYQLKLAAYNVVVADCEKKLLEITTNLNRCKAEFERLSQDFARTKAEFETITAKLRKTSAEYQVLKASYENLLQQYTVLLEYRKKRQTMLDEIRDRLNKCNDELAYCQSLLQKCTADRKRTTDEREYYLEVARQCNEQLLACKRALEECLARKQRLLADAETWKQRVYNCYAEYDECYRTMLQRQALNTKLSVYLEELKKRKLTCEQDASLYGKRLVDVEQEDRNLKSLEQQAELLHQGYVNMAQENLRGQTESVVACRRNVTTVFPPPPKPPEQPPPEEPPPPPPKVTFYDNPGYAGNSFTIEGAGEKNLNGDESWYAQISSIKIEGDAVVEVTAKGGRGTFRFEKSISFEGEDNTMGQGQSLDDEIEFVKVIPADPDEKLEPDSMFP